MKKLIIVTAFAVTTAFIAACNSGNNTTATTDTKDTATTNTGTVDANSKAGSNPTAAAAMTALVTPYLQLKNALTADNSSKAADAGTALKTAFEKFDQAALTAEQKKAYADIADDAHENAEHIGKSAGKLDHQREHFDMLSKDMYDLVHLIGAGQHLYVDHCPMYNNNKGANWLSENKEIRNPYLGQKMATCGVVKEELQ